VTFFSSNVTWLLARAPTRAMCWVLYLAHSTGPPMAAFGPDTFGYSAAMRPLIPKLSGHCFRGCRYDFVFASTQLKPAACEYHFDVVTRAAPALSDHALVTTRFEF